MYLRECIARRQFMIIFLALCIGTGICLLFYKKNAMGVSNVVRMFDLVVWNNEGNGNSSRLDCIELTLHFQDICDNFAKDNQVAIFKEFTELNDSYTLRLSQLKVILYHDKRNFIKTIPPSSDMVSDTVGFHNMTGSSSNDTKFILLWTRFFGEEHWLHTSRFENCKSRCVITTKKDDLPNSAAVIMHSRDMSGIQDLPKTRQHHQRWIYFAQESPPHIYLNLNQFNGIWNMTFTHRSDSDMWVGYGVVSPRGNPDQLFQEKLKNIINSKQKLVMARISNCDKRSSSRISYIRELQKYIEVDFYGACGDKKCPKQEQRCGADLMKQYKFTLAFENSNCRDYITEKFFHPLRTWQSVPVVMGGAGVGDYLRVAPPYSFIHVEGFESPKQLAAYLRFMNDHPDYYALLHHWRQGYGETATGQEQRNWCPFCDLLHNSSSYGQSYTDFKGWYNQDTCTR